MFQGLKIAIRRQKKLILIFLMTIFLPSVTLSIFGIIALRNERFRIEKQFREDQMDLVQLFKSEVNQKISKLENELQYIVLTPSFINNDYEEIIQLVENQLTRNPLSDQFFISSEREEPWFPPFRMAGRKQTPFQTRNFTDLQKQKLAQAENYEFSQHNYRAAISILKEMLTATEDKHLQGQLMNRIARNQMKQNNFGNAIKTYNEIISNFPESITSSGTPLPVTVRLQLAECYMSSGMKNEALKESLNAFEEIIRNFYNLNENQFSAYVSLVSEKFNTLRKDNQGTDFTGTDYTDEFENLNNRYQSLVMKWQVVDVLKNECIPKLSRDFMQNGNNTDSRLRYSEKIGSEDFLILSMIIPGETGTKPKGIAGIRINSTFLEDSLLHDILINIFPEKGTDLILSDAGGRIITGDTASYNKSTNIISYFDDNFPPWRIEVSGELTRPLVSAGFYKSFYFWSILTMMVILVFGIVIIGRTIAHEKEILQIKSDFVSSVSHEFKTPITSIKALTERLLEGTVKDQKRLREYYSVISRDAENLSRLVGNILDFSKIEEGKKEYDFEEADFKEWLEQTISDFSGTTQRGKIIFQSGIIDHSIPVKIDKASMKLAIDNLLDNAVKFSSENSEVNVILERQDKNLLVKIKDSGIGIPVDEQKKIFEKFYRGKDSAAYSATGTGLGLTIVKQVVEAHGGEIRVESEPGKGSRFFVILPMTDTEKDPLPSLPPGGKELIHTPAMRDKKGG